MTVIATIDNYATAAIEQTSGAANFVETGSNYLLKFGTIQQNSAAPTERSRAVLDAASGVAASMTGQFEGMTGGGFDLTGFGTVTALAAGQTDNSLSVSLNTSTLGQFTETITLVATGTNSSDYSGTLTPEILTITGTVACSPAAQRWRPKRAR